jgi:hypothetical protein
MDYKYKYLKYKRKYLELKHDQIDSKLEYNQNGGKYSEIFVYNNLLDIVEVIDYSNYNKMIHEYVNDKKLEKIAKKNDQNIKKVIKSRSNYNKKFYHISIKEFEYPILDKQSDFSSWLGENIYKNPKGIWISRGLSWQKFIGNFPSQWSLGTYIYEIAPSDSVLYISNLEELKEFIDLYMKTKPKISDIINWKKVKKQYDGLIICPYLGNKIWGKNAEKFGMWGDKNVDKYMDNIIDDKWQKKLFFTAEWYRHWETATGVIWKPSTGIRTIKLIKKNNINL